MPLIFNFSKWKSPEFRNPILGQTHLWITKISQFKGSRLNSVIFVRPMRTFVRSPAEAVGFNPII